MRVCILGAGGVFGTNLAAYLLSQKHEVMGIGRNPKKPPCFSLGVEYPYHAYHIGSEFEYVIHTIRQWEPDVIVNFAAQGEGAASWGSDNWRFYDTNCTALVRLVSAISGHFVQIGSSEVYGSVDKPVDENYPLNPTSPYSVSKAAFDLHLVAMHKVKGLNINIIRPSNCYAPGQQLHRIIPKALISACLGLPIPLHGGGVARKSYLHATDLSTAILMVIEKGSIGEIYNAGPDEPTPIREVVERCLTEMRVSHSLIREAPERTGQDSCYWLNSSKLKALGWKQEIEWDAGLADMHNWMLQHTEVLTMPTDFRMRA